MKELIEQKSDGKDQVEFDESFWKAAESSFQKQNLPSYQKFDSVYPKINGGKMPGPQVFELVGGEVLALANQHNYTNACATRVSRALNYSNVVIPHINEKTFKGADNKYYFLGAANLIEWMKATFGNPHISLDGNQTKVDGSGFIKATEGKPGIYGMIPNYPDKFGASGHADNFDGQKMNVGGYFNAEGGVYRTYLWKLQQ